jgi:hypothetical protein
VRLRRRLWGWKVRFEAIVIVSFGSCAPEMARRFVTRKSLGERSAKNHRVLPSSSDKTIARNRPVVNKGLESAATIAVGSADFLRGLVAAPEAGVSDVGSSGGRVPEGGNPRQSGVILGSTLARRLLHWLWIPSANCLNKLMFFAWQGVDICG